MMLINKTEFIGSVEFISYTGKYPNLCRGVLTLRIDGKEIKFGHDYNNYNFKTGKFEDNNYDSFWTSGGGITRSGQAYGNDWIIDCNDIPDEYKKYAAEIDDVFNSNVVSGCCGGCW